VVAVGDLDGHLVPHAAAGLDDGRDPGLGRQLDAVREREVGIGGHDAERGSLAGLAQCHFHADHPRRLAGTHPDHDLVLGQHDRVGLHVADRAPGEEEVDELLQGRVAIGHHIGLVPILGDEVFGLDQQSAADPFEIQVAGAVGRLVASGRHFHDLETLLDAQDGECLRRVAGGHDGLEEAGGDGPRGEVIHHPVGADDPAVGGHAVALQGLAEGIGQIHHAGQPGGVAVLDDGHGRRLEVRRDPPRGIEVEQVVEGQILARDLARPAEDRAAVIGIGVEGGLLLRILAVAKIGLLLEHEGQPGREARPGQTVEVGGQLGVVGGGQGEGVRRQLQAGLGGHHPIALHVAQDRGVLGGAADHRHPVVGGGRGPEKRGAGQVQLGWRGGRGVEVDHHHDHLVTEGAVEGRVGQVRERVDRDPGLGQVGARLLGGDAGNPGVEEATSQLGDPFAVRNGEQGAQSTISLRKDRPADYTDAPCRLQLAARLARRGHPV